MHLADTRSLPFIPLLVAGFVAVLVGYSSSAAIIWQAAQAAGATPAQTAGWFTMLGLAMGVATLALSLRTRLPVIAAWSTPGAALLATSVEGLNLNEVIGVFVAVNLLILLSGVTGIFARLMRFIPPALAAAMLAGILLRYGIGTFTGLESNAALCGTMCLVWLLCRRWLPRYAIILALIAGAGVTLLQQSVILPPHSFSFALPAFVMPHFTLAALTGVALPCFLITMASQNAPGIATLQAHGYQPPVSMLTSWTGAIALICSPFGGFSVCVGAISAAICMGDEVDPDPARRWIAAVCAGGFYLLAGLCGALIAALLGALPAVLIATLAGLALLNTLAGSLQRALQEPDQRDSAIITVMITASGISLAGIGSAFWGMAGGGLVHLLLTARRRG